MNRRLIDPHAYGIVVVDDSICYISGGKYYYFDFSTVQEIDESTYRKYKFGETNQHWDQVYYDVAHLRNGDFITVFYQECVVRYHAPDGRVLRELASVHAPNGFGIYGLSIDLNDHLWVAVPSEHYIGQFDAAADRALFSICGTAELEPTIFNHPEDVMVIGDQLYVSDMGNERVVQLDIGTREIVGEEKVGKPVYYYNRVGACKVYLLEGGLFCETLY